MISVIICTMNRADKLKNCLDSLQKQSFKDFEVVVIDGGSTDSTVKTAKKYAKTRVIVEKKRGLSIARNLGIREAEGDIVSFTDDDCVASKDWLKEINSTFEELNPDVVVGSSFPYGDAPIYASIIMNPAPRWVARSEIVGHGNNMSFRKKLFLKVGLFDEKLGVGTPLGGTDDMDMMYRVLRKRGKVYYNPEVKVYHDAPLTPEKYAKTKYGYALGFGGFLRKHQFDGKVFFLFAAMMLKRGLKAQESTKGVEYKGSLPLTVDRIRGLIRGYFMY